MSVTFKGREAALGFAWMFGILDNDATLLSLAVGGIWRGYAPPGTATPFIQMQHQTGTDTVTFGAVRSYGSHLYYIRAVGPASETVQVRDAYARVDALLDGAIGTNIPGSDGLVMAAYRTQPLEMESIITGETWSEIGGLYRLTMRPQGG